MDSSRKSWKRLTSIHRKNIEPLEKQNCWNGRLLGEQLQKIVLLEQILAELAAYEKVTGQEAADKIE